MPAPVGLGKRPNIFVAFGSMRPAGIWFKAQAPAPMLATPKLAVVTGQAPVPKVALRGSRTKPVEAATIPVTGSGVPAVVGRVVAGSRIVPTPIKRPRASALAA